MHIARSQARQPIAFDGMHFAESSRSGEGGHANTFFIVLRAARDCVRARVSVHIGVRATTRAARARGAGR
ncbi:hypothetical protein BVI434_70023 [Burkholderia vietnamiensis]|nr:hypothetical protein BVI434_70023 [Burkholderia vietnamiensis]